MDDPVIETETEVTETEETEVETEPTDDLATWKKEARKWEKLAKKNLKDTETLSAKLKEKEDADKSEHEKAVEAARQEGEKVARTEAEKERRADRLESATIRLAAKGFKLKDDEGKEVTLKFADADDAFVYVERAMSRNEIDTDDLFDEQGKVQTDALTSALTEILASKPHLAEGSVGSRKVSGSADGGKGSGGGKSLEDMTPEEHFKRLHAA